MSNCLFWCRVDESYIWRANTSIISFYCLSLSFFYSRSLFPESSSSFFSFFCLLSHFLSSNLFIFRKEFNAFIWPSFSFSLSFLYLSHLSFFLSLLISSSLSITLSLTIIILFVFSFSSWLNPPTIICNICLLSIDKGELGCKMVGSLTTGYGSDLKLNLSFDLGGGWFYPPLWRIIFFRHPCKQGNLAIF